MLFNTRAHMHTHLSYLSVYFVFMFLCVFFSSSFRNSARALAKMTFHYFDTILFVVSCSLDKLNTFSYRYLVRTLNRFIHSLVGIYIICCLLYTIIICIFNYVGLTPFKIFFFFFFTFIYWCCSCWMYSSSFQKKKN